MFYGMIDALDTTEIEFFGLSISVKKALGTFFMLNSILGPVLFTIGSLALGLGGLIQVLGPAAVGFIRLFRGIVGMIPGAGKLLSPLFAALEAAAVTAPFTGLGQKGRFAITPIWAPGSWDALFGKTITVAGRTFTVAQLLKGGLTAFFAVNLVFNTIGEIQDIFKGEKISMDFIMNSLFDAALIGLVLGSTTAAGLAFSIPIIITATTSMIVDWLEGEKIDIKDIALLLFGSAIAGIALGSVTAGILAFAIPVGVYLTVTFFTKSIRDLMEVEDEVSREFIRGFEERLSRFPPEFQRQFKEDLRKAMLSADLAGVGHDVAADVFTLSNWKVALDGFKVDLNEAVHNIGKDMNYSMASGVRSTTNRVTSATRNVTSGVLKEYARTPLTSFIEGKRTSEKFGQGISQQAKIPIDNTKYMTKVIITDVKSVPETIKNELAKGTIKNALQTGLVQPLVNSYNTAISFLYSLVDWFKWASKEISVYSSRMFSGGYFTAMFTPWWAMKSVAPGLQYGGIVTRPTLAMIGEKGPEAVVPLNRGYGQPVYYSPTINIEAHVTSDIDIRELAEKLNEHMAADYRRLTRSSYLAR